MYIYIYIYICTYMHIIYILISHAGDFCERINKKTF